MGSVHLPSLSPFCLFTACDVRGRRGGRYGIQEGPGVAVALTAEERQDGLHLEWWVEGVTWATSVLGYPGEPDPGFLPSSPAGPAPLSRARPPAKCLWGRSRPGRPSLSRRQGLRSPWWRLCRVSGVLALLELLIVGFEKWSFLFGRQCP